MDHKSQEMALNNEECGVKKSAEKYVDKLTQVLARDYESFPGCCKVAALALKQIMKENDNIELTLQRGSLNNIPKNEMCYNHTWLEYNDLIIDLTDYQFEAIDLWDLPLEVENFIPEDIDISSLSKEEAQKVFMCTYVKNAKKRYQDNPNQKEQYFIDLKNMAKNDQISSDIFFSELKRCFGAKTFYDKKDPNIVYTVRDEAFFEENKMAPSW